ncbi:hypothetical protein [Telmatospirillum siberiense]|uniref:Flagellar protein FlgN n=1 Tax=Telmatospirillum siberiense TaxID=382514 RepID=A0A2N3Q030_9PROT|nr:hypothetical protein [Telmatospirillum siberiense]PKU26005.1 hypothetical protein CWS72_02350 [Telmatospirillum siberiense]
MRYDSEGRESLNLLQKKAARKLAEIHQLMAPGLAAPAGLEELQHAAQLRMAELSPVEREKLKAKAIVAMSHLERLMSEMSQQLVDIGEELRKVNRQGQAVGAYGKTVARAGRHRPAYM